MRVSIFTSDALARILKRNHQRRLPAGSQARTGMDMGYARLMIPAGNAKFGANAIDPKIKQTPVI